MSDDRQLPRRRSIRLRDYDYRSQGAYFVTICTLNRECLFGEVRDGSVLLNAFGGIAQTEWLQSAEMRREIELDEFVVMPNHQHGIVVIVETCGARNDARGRPPDAPTGRARPAGGLPTFTPTTRPASRSLGAFINGYKAAVTRTIRSIHGTDAASVWQRNYYEHVIRNDEDLDRIRHYIRDNPAHWTWDRENPNRDPTPPGVHHVPPDL
jgi:REP element-mobilizing transposase RayT